MNKVGWKELLIAGYIVLTFTPVLSLQYLFPHEPLVRGPWKYLWLGLLIAAPLMVINFLKRTRRRRAERHEPR